MKFEKTKCMNGLWWQILVVFFIFIFAFPIFIEVRFSFNPIQNRGVVALFVFRIKIFYIIFSFHGKEIEIKNEKEAKVQKLEFESEKFELMENFGKQIVEKINLKKIYVFYNLGVGGSMQTALLCGVVNQIFNQIFLRIKSKKPTASLCVFDNPSFNNTETEFACRGRVSICVFDVVYSFVNSVILMKSKA